MYAFESTMGPTEPFSPIHSQRARSFSRPLNDRWIPEQQQPAFNRLSPTLEQEEKRQSYPVGEQDETPMDPFSPTVETSREPSPAMMNRPVSSKPFPRILHEKPPPGMEGQPNEEPFVSRAGEQSWTTVQPFSPKTESKPTSKPLSPRMRSDPPEKLSPRKCQFSPEQVSPGKGQKDLRQLSPRPAQDTPEQFSPVTRDRRPSEPVSPGATSNPTGSGFSPAVGDLDPTADQSPTATDEPNPARQYLSSMGGSDTPKQLSGNNDAESWVPASMRALYYAVAPAVDSGIASGLPEGVYTSEADLQAAPAPQTGLILDTGFPTPQPSSNQYLLKVQTAAFCQDELRLASELNPPRTTPQIPLHSICGTVISTPPQDEGRPFGPRYRIGDVVFGVLSYTRDGGAADYVVATEGELTMKPRSIKASEAAALALPALTAWQALFRYAGLDPDNPQNYWKGTASGYNSGGSSGINIGRGSSKGSGKDSGSGGSGSGSGSGSGMSGRGSGRGYGYGWRRKSIDFMNAHGFGNRKSGNGNEKNGSSSSNYSNGGSDSSSNWRKKSIDFISGQAFNNNGGFRKKKDSTLRVLVTNARDSEVGRISVQLLRAEKLFSSAIRPWICVTCTPAEEQSIRQVWDVDEVFVIPHLPTRDECDLGAMFRSRRLSPVDIVLDCTGGEVFQEAHSPAVIKDQGTVLTAVDPQPAKQPTAIEGQEASRRRKRGIRSRFVPVNPDAAALARMIELVDDNSVRGNEEQVVDLVQASKLLEGRASATAGYRRGSMMVVRVN